MNIHKIAVATKYNYSTNVFKCVNHIECPRPWLFHLWHSTRSVHSTRGINEMCLFHATENVVHVKTLWDLSNQCHVTMHFRIWKNEVIVERYCSYNLKIPGQLSLFELGGMHIHCSYWSVMWSYVNVTVTILITGWAII